MSRAKPATILRAAEIAERSQSFSHPWNPESEIRGLRLSQESGCERTGISWARIEPGKESFVYHSHECEEEWIYILRGQGVVRIDDEDHELGPGDFVGFPAPSVAHHLRNASDRPLEYLMGGESRDLEVADFPDLNKRMIRRSDQIDVYSLDQAEPFPVPGEGTRS